MESSNWEISSVIMRLEPISQLDANAIMRLIIVNWINWIIYSISYLMWSTRLPPESRLHAHDNIQELQRWNIWTYRKVQPQHSIAKITHKLRWVLFMHSNKKTQFSDEPNKFTQNPEHVLLNCTSSIKIFPRMLTNNATWYHIQRGKFDAKKMQNYVIYV